MTGASWITAGECARNRDAGAKHVKRASQVDDELSIRDAFGPKRPSQSQRIISATRIVANYRGEAGFTALGFLVLQGTVS